MPLYAPGFIVQFPEEGKPEKLIVATGEVQLGLFTLTTGGVGLLLTVTKTVSVLEQPLLSVPVNV